MKFFIFLPLFFPLFCADQPQEVFNTLNNIQSKHKERAVLHDLGETHGGLRLGLLQVCAEKEKAPGVLVVANMQGDSPMATQAALHLISLLIQQETKPEVHWFVAPVGNPEGYSSLFKKPLWFNTKNSKPFNDDKDDGVDEDGPEDLNGDGLVTQMRQLHPEGEWMQVKDKPGVLKKADKAKGEMGIYRLYEEGRDNDQDGLINEDGPGGVNPGFNFPHNFEHYTSINGPWAASEKESRALLKFAFDHPEIGMVIVLGASNSLFKVPEDEEIHKEDLKYWEKVSKLYKEFLKEAELDGKRRDPEKFPPGSISQWAYFQYGVPAFALDFWTLPMKEEEKKEESEDKEKMSFDEALFDYDPSAFLPWRSFSHPDLGPVEIGGRIPYSGLIPKKEMIQELIRKQVPFIFHLAKLLPRVKIAKVEVKRIATEIWRIQAWVKNTGFLPYPTFHGKITKRPAPLMLLMDHKNLLLEGKPRVVISQLEGSGGVEKITWLVRGPLNDTITLRLTSPSIGEDVVTVKLQMEEEK